MRRIGEKNIILGDGRGFEVNETGRIVWENIGKISNEDIVLKILDSSDITISEVKEDIKSFVDFLVENGLISIINEE